ncbi:GntR family transcriptional regulator [Microlunatus flavus]|uniref:DNA-binding transcriptional regulator, GntR family n=1 Tax=Microlunatus flavus TaxID=1036181 RepID=A0A1H9C4J2_9ACTN|nr:GntR family transcriptional regulator [Microlunatus flavus]SEP96052.1 DNA-binding transcriptional regulator, GntR family [Microlunatus flavus]
MGHATVAGTLLLPSPEPRASDLAYLQLREMVVDLRLPPGSVLNEQQLAASTGFGRMPVREAIARLAADRFVSVLPRRGTFVNPLGLDEVLAMFEAREAIECGVAHLAARRATVPQLERLHELAGLADEVRADDAIEEHLHADHAIHTHLVGMTGNELLVEAVERLLLHSLRFWRSYWTTHEPRASAMLSHAELVTAVQDHDPEAAEHAMRAHLAVSRGTIQDAFRH